MSNPAYAPGAFFKSNLGPTRAERKSSSAKAIEAARKAAYRAVDRRDGNVCRVCDRKVQRQHLGLDLAEHHHIVGRGGLDAESSQNIALLCRSCHDDRHVKRTLHISGNADKTLRCERGKAVWLSPNPQLARRGREI